jgi:hypothetical protein
MNDPVREELHGAIQASAAHNDDIEGAMLKGWVTIAEWVAPDGERWLSVAAAGSSPADPAPDWQIQGYLFNILHKGPAPD